MDNLEIIKSRIQGRVEGQLLAQRVAKAKAANQVLKPVDDAVVNETARRGMLAQAESEERLAAIADQRADEAHASMMRAPTDLVSFYSQKEQAHRRTAREHRDAADAHRRAAAAL
jgi:hypothetical protein